MTTRLTALTLSLFALAGPARGETIKGLVYKTTPQAKLKMYVHLPKGWKAADKRPAIVFFFGGGWAKGSVKQFERQARYLASRGMVAARADYRVKSRHGVKPDDCVRDAKSAVAYLRANANRLGIDPRKVVASGGSAGGHIAAATALCPDIDVKNGDEASSVPNALVLFNPALRFAGVAGLMKRIGNDEDLGEKLSPTLHIDAKTPPTILFFGSKDGLTVQGREFAKKASAAGVTAKLDVAPGVGHGYFNRDPHFRQTLRAADEFLQRIGYLEGDATIDIPPMKR